MGRDSCKIDWSQETIGTLTLKATVLGRANEIKSVIRITHIWSISKSFQVHPFQKVHEVSVDLVCRRDFRLDSFCLGIAVNILHYIEFPTCKFGYETNITQQYIIRPEYKWINTTSSNIFYICVFDHKKITNLTDEDKGTLLLSTQCWIFFRASMSFCLYPYSSPSIAKRRFGGLSELSRFTGSQLLRVRGSVVGLHVIYDLNVFLVGLFWDYKSYMGGWLICIYVLFINKWKNIYYLVPSTSIITW